MSRGFSSGLTRRWSFPRVSGDEPAARRGDLLMTQFSPRERG